MTTSPFSVRRRIAWGECDPARIYYTPHAVDYAAEAVEAWYETVLGVSWSDLAASYGLNVPFDSVDCDFRRPLVASQVIQLRVRVTQVESTGVTFSVVGEDNAGVSCFQACLVSRFVARGNADPVPIPAELRRRIEDCQLQSAGAETDLNDSKHAKEPPGTDETDRYYPLPAAAVFTRQRRPVYGDCDASGTVYAPRVFVYVVETVGEWYEEVLGISWMDLVCTRGQGAPFVSARCKYLRAMLPGRPITIAVRVTRLGGASIRFAVIGYDAAGKTCFDARVAACFIDQDGFKVINIPEGLRQRIKAYQTSCEETV